MAVALELDELDDGLDGLAVADMISSLLVSNEPIYIDHYNSLFEQLWDNSIDAMDRINDIK